MKAYWKSGDMATRILNLGTWRGERSASRLAASVSGKDSRTHWTEGLVGLTAILDAVAKTEMSVPCSCPESNLGYKAHGLITILTCVVPSDEQIKESYPDL
jgi:hypothetical protein